MSLAFRARAHALNSSRCLRMRLDWRDVIVHVLVNSRQNEKMLIWYAIQISELHISLKLKQKSILDNFGGFKKSMKLTFVYEFLLRLTYNSARIMTIPRLGYKHVNMRESSIFWNYKNGKNILTDEEVKFWIDTAKKEYFFTNDRDIKYEETNS